MICWKISRGWAPETTWAPMKKKVATRPSTFTPTDDASPPDQHADDSCDHNHHHQVRDTRPPHAQQALEFRLLPGIKQPTNGRRGVGDQEENPDPGYQQSAQQGPPRGVQWPNPEFARPQQTRDIEPFPQPGQHEQRDNHACCETGQQQSAIER